MGAIRDFGVGSLYVLYIRRLIITSYVQLAKNTPSGTAGRATIYL
ncbi:hypothetical protein Z949_1794 [Sulfitobacter guttiformis KCTC 32187]|nr:hypothetical protein Z949_1794 [Sulfitobacter guttiformis KCTC 32187]